MDNSCLGERKNLRNGALPLMMGNYARNFGVKLYMYGHHAYTDGTRITIPRLDLEDRDSLEFAYAYVAHECGHVRYSDFSTLQKTKNLTTLASLFNVLEDCRIEYLQIKDWPGLAQNFNALVTMLCSKYTTATKKLKDKGDVASLLVLYVGLYCRFNELQQVGGEKALKNIRRHLKNLIGEGIINVIDNKCQGICNLTESIDCFNIAENIYELVIGYILKIKHLGDELSNEGVEENNITNNYDVSNSENDLDLQSLYEAKNYYKQEDYEESEDVNAQSEQVLNSSENSVEDNSSSIDYKEKPSDLTRYYRDIFEQEFNKLSESLKKQITKDLENISSNIQENAVVDKTLINANDLIISKSKYDVNFSFNIKQKNKPSYISISFNASCNKDLIDAEKYLEGKSFGINSSGDFGQFMSGDPIANENSVLYEKVSHSNLLRNKICDLIKGYDRYINGNCNSSSILDPRRYYLRKMNGYRNLFKRKVVHKAFNTNIHLLVDSSGSMINVCKDMQTKRYEVANEVALSLALALENISNVSLHVTYFPGSVTECEEIYKPGQYAVLRSAYFDQQPKGCTPLAQGLMHATFNMPKFDKYQRNIIIIITDGLPDSKEATELRIQEAKELGIQVYAIRIGNQGVNENLFPISTYIEDASELPDALYGILANNLFVLK